jgi:hypothetical protein
MTNLSFHGLPFTHMIWVQPLETPAFLEKYMKRVLAACLLLTMTPVLSSVPAQTQKPEVAKVSLKVGDAAPDFALLSDKWKTVKLSDYHGKRNVFLAIYVLAFTGG